MQDLFSRDVECIVRFFRLFGCCALCNIQAIFHACPCCCSKKLGYVPDRDSELRTVRPSFQVSGCTSQVIVSAHLTATYNAECYCNRDDCRSTIEGVRLQQRTRQHSEQVVCGLLVSGFFASLTASCPGPARRYTHSNLGHDDADDCSEGGSKEVPADSTSTLLEDDHAHLGQIG